MVRCHVELPSMVGVRRRASCQGAVFVVKCLFEVSVDLRQKPTYKPLAVLMLPVPAATTRRRPYTSRSLSIGSASLSRRGWRRYAHFILARSRVTNLAVLILSACLLLSTLLNFRHYYLSDRRKHGGFARHGPFHRLRSIEDTIERPPALQALRHLILVPGHAVWLGRDANDALNETAWVLEPYQRGPGAETHVEAFVNHVRKGCVCVSI